jgi:MFS family permease
MTSGARGTSAPTATPGPAYGVVWAIFVFAWVANYLVRMALPALLGPVMGELRLSYGEAGILAAAIFYAYMAMQVPAGMLGDRVGRTRVVTAGLVLCSLASIATGLSGGLTALVLARLATGIAQGCLFSNDRVVIAGCTPPPRMALGQGVSFSGPGLGITLGLVLAGALGEIVPWRWVFFVFALPPLAAAALVGWFVPEPPRIEARPRDWPLRRLLAVRDLWVLGLACAMPLYVQFAVATWAPLMFGELGVSELGRAGRYAGAQGLAAPLGLLFWGWIADRLEWRGVPRPRLIAVGLVASAAATLGMAWALAAKASPPALLGFLLAAVFCSWGIWGPSFAVLGQLFPPGVHGTAFGLFNTVAFLGAITGPAVTGALRDATGSFASGCLLGAGLLLLGAALAALMRGPGGAGEASRG